MTDFNEIRNKHFEKRCDLLRDMSKNRSILSYLNCVLLDGDTDKTAEIKEIAEKGKIAYRTYNAAESIRNKSRMRIVYLLPHSGIMGGTKILVEQSNRLAGQGHEVAMYSHWPKPEWIRCGIPYFTVHPENNLSDVIPAADVVIAGYWDMVVDALRINAPLKYHFAQGDMDIFQYDSMGAGLKEAISTAYTLPVKILTVSRLMQQKIDMLFGRKSVLIPNALDKSIFHTGPRKPEEKEETVILLVGSDSQAFKGHEMIVRALFALKEMGYKLDIRWLTPVKLCKDYSRLSVKEIIAPPQAQIGNIYRESDILVSGSYFEAFSLPPLEAMTCGCAVAASDNGGIREYAADGYNCLLFEPGNVSQLVEKLSLLIDNVWLRERLREGGIATGRKFSWKRSVKILESELTRSARYTGQVRPV